MYVSLHIKPTASKGKHENPAAIILAYHTDNDWGSFMRTFNHRGISDRSMATRPCDQEEYDECAHKYRLSYLEYRDWDALIKDEKKFGVDDEWINRLQELKLQYPQFCG